MKNKITEIGPRAFPFSEIKPNIKVGDMVFVKWANNQTYRGVIKEKLRKNWGLEITDDNWHYSSNRASVPEYALIKRWYKTA